MISKSYRYTKTIVDHTSLGQTILNTKDLFLDMVIYSPGATINPPTPD
ncbi:MAG: hypothetical protein M3162_04815 [Thermoproteota archaeon]|nr:hypothetical protein [Thermoproteota archaeon]